MLSDDWWSFSIYGHSIWTVGIFGQCTNIVAAFKCVKYVAFELNSIGVFDDFLVEGRFRTCASKWKQTSAHRPQFIQRNLCTQKFIFTQFIPDGYVITVWFWKYQWVQSTTVAHPQSHMHFQPNSPLFDNLSNVIDKWNIPTNDFYSLVVWYFSHACASLSVCLSPCVCVCLFNTRILCYSISLFHLLGYVRWFCLALGPFSPKNTRSVIFIPLFNSPFFGGWLFFCVPKSNV